jgi:acetone carboxylase alpha subunit
MIHHVPWVAMGGMGFGSKFPSTLGLFGGYAVPPLFTQIVHGSNVRALLEASDSRLPHGAAGIYSPQNPEEGSRTFHHISMAFQPLMNGDTYYLVSGGGAGYGDALERDPEAVIRDLKAGLTTAHAAENVYLVAYDPETFRLDPERTAELRAEARRGRLTRGKPYAAFVEEWSQLRPPDALLQYYGTYPNPRDGLAAGQLAGASA